MHPASRLLLAIVFAFLASCGGGGSPTDPLNTGGTDNGGTNTGGGGTTSGVDLAVTNISAPASANADSSINVSVTIANVGSSDAYGAGVSLSLNYYGSAGDDSMGGLGIYYSLPAGGSAAQTISMNIPRDTATGRYYLVAKIHYDSAEANTANNTTTTQIDITGTTCTPDAAEQDNGTTQAAILQIGVPLTRNHCEGSADWFRFDATVGDQFGVRVDESSDAWVSLAVYNTDGATLLTSTGTINDSSSSAGTRPKWMAPATGTYYVRVAPQGGLMSAGANTDYTATLGDLRPDLVAQQGLYVYPTSNVVTGGIIYVADTVANKGFANAGAFNVGIYLSDDATVTTADRLIGTRSLASLALGDSSYNSYPNDTYSVPTGLTPGTYYVAAIANHDGALSGGEINANNNATNAVAITIIDPGCAADAFEDDDTSGAAKDIVVGDPAQTHNHCEDTIDWVRFSATSGASYAIRTAPYGVSVELYSDPTGSPETPGSSWTASTTAAHYLKVKRTSLGGDYTIKIDPVLPDLTSSIYNFSGFTVIAGGLLSIDDRATNIGHIASGPFKLGVYRGTSSAVTSADDLVSTRDIPGLETNTYGGGTFYGTTLIQFPKNMPPGTYYLGTVADYDGAVAELSETNNAATSTVAVTVTAPVNCTLDAYEDDDFSSQAKVITAGVAQTHNFCDDGRDWVSFTPTVDGTYLVVADGMYVDGVKLYAADGVTAIAPHATDFDQMSFVASAGQTYYVKTNGSMTTTTNSTAYTLSLTQCALDVYEDDDTLAAAKSITPSTSQNRNHCDDEDDWISFDAVSGTTYTFTGTNVGASASVSLRLYDSAGNILESGSTKGNKQTLTWIATGTGKYYIHAYSGSSTWGLNHEYTLGMN